MKAIFLDIDGVLNDEEHIKFIFNTLGKAQYFTLLNALGETPFDIRCVLLLQELVFATDAKIILTSTWRLSNKSVDLFEKVTGCEVFGKTRNLSDGTRGDEIKDYLSNHPDITQYIILDDDRDMLEEQKENFVLINRSTGLTKEDYKKCLELLKDEESDEKDLGDNN